jgi:hypothetical protein
MTIKKDVLSNKNLIFPMLGCGCGEEAGLSGAPGTAKAIGVNGWRKRMMVFAGWVFPLVAAHGQLLTGEVSADGRHPPPPASGVRDENGVFARNSESLGRISDALRRLEESHGFRIHVVVEPVMIGTSPQELAATLEPEWLPDGDGLIVVYEADTMRIGVSRSADGEWTSATPRVPAYETMSILSKVMREVDREGDSIAILESLVLRLAEGYRGYFERLETPVATTRSLRMVLMISGILCLSGLAVLGIGLVLCGGDRREKTVFRFPAVDVPERLGAPYGGGSVAARRFRRRDER